MQLKKFNIKMPRGDFFKWGDNPIRSGWVPNHMGDIVQVRNHGGGWQVVWNVCWNKTECCRLWMMFNVSVPSSTLRRPPFCGHVPSNTEMNAKKSNKILRSVYFSLPENSFLYFCMLFEMKLISEKTFFNWTACLFLFCRCYPTYNWDFLINSESVHLRILFLQFVFLLLIVCLSITKERTSRFLLMFFHRKFVYWFQSFFTIFLVIFVSLLENWNRWHGRLFFITYNMLWKQLWKWLNATKKIG